MTSTIVGWHFSASHTDPVRQELHGHSYEVEAEFVAGRDALDLQAALRHVLDRFDHHTLPDDLSRAEPIAQAVLDGLAHLGCVRVRLWRPLERLGAEAKR